MSNAEDRKEASIYELSYLVLPSIAEDKLSDVVDTIKGIIKKVGGKELDGENPIDIDLAYTMDKTIGSRKYVADNAYIGWVKFEVEAPLVGEIDSAMKKLDEILRFLIVKAERETHFTFAEAEKARKDKEKALQEAAEEAQAEQVEKVVE